MCGTNCKTTVIPEYTAAQALSAPYVKTTCKPFNMTDSNKWCTNIVKQPYSHGYWTEMILINNNRDAVAHPIHQHGGWYWVVGVDKFPHNINKTWIMEKDTS